MFTSRRLNHNHHHSGRPPAEEPVIPKPQLPDAYYSDINTDLLGAFLRMGTHRMDVGRLLINAMQNLGELTRLVQSQEPSAAYQANTKAADLIADALLLYFNNGGSSAVELVRFLNTRLDALGIPR